MAMEEGQIRDLGILILDSSQKSSLAGLGICETYDLDFSHM
jgi:hypothetical protein